MTKNEVLSDITRLVNGSESIDHASSLIDDYMDAATTLSSLAKFVAVNDPRPATMGTARDEEESDDFFGGGKFGGGGASGSW